MVSGPESPSADAAADDWAGGAISEEQAQDKEAATAARLEGLLMAACASPVDDWGLQGSIALPSYATAPATHPTDVATRLSSSAVLEGEEWPLQCFAAARKRAAASYDADVYAAPAHGPWLRATPDVRLRRAAGWPSSSSWRASKPSTRGRSRR